MRGALHWPRSLLTQLRRRGICHQDSRDTKDRDPDSELGYAAPSGTNITWTVAKVGKGEHPMSRTSQS